jgi:GH35 family endo-1,4-beta-xylanase
VQTATAFHIACATAVIWLAASSSVRAQSATEPALAPAAIAQRIQQHRTTEAELTLRDARMKPLARQEVVVRMIRHKFLFGCNAFLLDPTDVSAAQQAYQRQFTNLLNYATVGFYWGNYERQPGSLLTEKLRRQATWLNEHGLRVKGHPLMWNLLPPRWLPREDPARVRQLQYDRIGREVREFAGVIDTWDVINEVVDWPRRQKEYDNPLTALGVLDGGLELVRRSFDAARRAHPQAFLLLNDFNTSPDYAGLIRQSLDAGIAIDAIGIQSHMHGGAWSPEQTWTVLERFAPFQKPLHFTETTIVSGAKRERIDYNRRVSDWPTTPEGEAAQARQVAAFYTLLFSHPAVAAITWWDFSDGQWLGAPAGLVRQDMTPKPAYQALLKLIREDWWTPEQRLKTDAQGRVRFRGFLGTYRVETKQGAATAFLARAVRERQDITVRPTKP